MSRVRLIALFSAVALTCVGVVSVVGAFDEPKAGVNLSVGSSGDDTHPTTPSGDVELGVPTTEAAEATTTTTTARNANATTTTTSVTAPSTTTTTVRVGDPTKAIVVAVNHTEVDVRMWAGDDSEHEAVLSPGESVEWRVVPSNSHPDSGGAVAADSFCGGKWSDQNNLLAGHVYTMEAVPGGNCANGFTMPTLNLKDETTNSEKQFVGGPIPDANHAIIYVVNKFTAPVKIALSDDSSHEWTLVPNEWGATVTLKTSNEHGDGVSITRVDLPCGWGDGEDYFKGGHTYRLEALAGQNCPDGPSGPNLIIKDLNTGTSRSLDPSVVFLPRTG